jgi:hypothetical protein
MTNKDMLEKTQGAMEIGQSRDSGNIGHKRQKQIK